MGTDALGDAAGAADSEATIKVLIVDDHAVVRQGLRTFLELQGEVSDGGGSELPIEVVGEAVNGVEAVKMARRLQPDVILLDLVMPEMDGIEAMRRILEDSPNSRVLILTSFGEEDRLFPAIRAGAQGYLLKDIPPGDLVQAVRAAYLGQVQLHPEVARKLMSAVAAKVELPAGRAPASFGELTERELEVLQLVVDGRRNKEVAAELGISENTVKYHLRNILDKLHARSRAEMVARAVRGGLVADG